MDVGSIVLVVVSGLALGSLYCIMSMGLALTFSTLKAFNFSHGAFIALGAYLTHFFLTTVGVPYVLAVMLMIVCCLVIGIVTERTILKRLLAKGLMEIIIGTLGVALLIENIILLTFGGRLKRLPIPIEGAVVLGKGSISYYDLFILACGLFILAVMAYYLKRTRFGMAMRAVAQDKEASYVVGIPVAKVNMYTFAVSVALAGLAGAFMGSIYFMTPSMGNEVLTKAFLICVLAGLGSIKGTVLAAYLIGIIESLTALVLGIYWTPLVLFAFMMAILIIRPSGLFSEEA